MNSLGFDKPSSKTRVVVAMSGGVDSSVVACQMKEQGYDVIGITLQLYDSGEVMKKKNACCAGTDIYDAKKVAEKYEFPHYILNYQSLFKQEVIDDFADSYLSGETPIPCVKCNQSVKFRDLLKVAKDLGADALATGHYVQRKVVNGQVEMHKAFDASKDQSYFLFATTKEQLDFLRFPLGTNNKEFTRKEAVRFGLEVASKPDSQDICFVPNGDYAEVIRRHRPQAFQKGDIVHIASGKIFGKHEGIVNFTLGQRRGLGLAHPKPLYVIKIDSKTNQVFVGEEEFLNKQKFLVRDLNWISCSPKIGKKISAFVRIRSNGHEQPAEIEIIDSNDTNKSMDHEKSGLAMVVMKSMTRAITPGQACVIYQDSRVLGGGWITSKIS